MAQLKFTHVIDLRPSLLPVSVQFIVLDKGEVKARVDGASGKKLHTSNLLAADSTAAVFLQLVNDECEQLQPADICTLTGGIFAMETKGCILRAGRKGVLTKVGEFCMVSAEQPNLSTIPWELNKETNLYEPREALPSRTWHPPQLPQPA
ncbi:hypothetical protein WJX81_008435 [Elliptochloris bilobata]|uniref:Uncharacterized protein n=1 Tax=Elliptochloris bilobata TaxID=381761 RepID=A0AAW1QTM1_9CHLO